MKFLILFAVLSVALVESAGTKDPGYQAILNDATEYMEITLGFNKNNRKHYLQAAKGDNVDQVEIVKKCNDLWHSNPLTTRQKLAFDAIQVVRNKEFFDITNDAIDYMVNVLKFTPFQAELFVRKAHIEHPDQSYAVSYVTHYRQNKPDVDPKAIAYVVLHRSEFAQIFLPFNLNSTGARSKP